MILFLIIYILSFLSLLGLNWVDRERADKVPVLMMLTPGINTLIVLVFVAVMIVITIRQLRIFDKITSFLEGRK